MNNKFFDSDPELNITPFVDVMLVLLVVVILIMPSVKYDEDINLPTGSKQTKSKIKNNDVQIKIKKDIIVLNNKEFKYDNFFDNFALIKHTFNYDTIFFIAADKDISYGKVMSVFAMLSKFGFSKISLQTK